VTFVYDLTCFMIDYVMLGVMFASFNSQMYVESVVLIGVIFVVERLFMTTKSLLEFAFCKSNVRFSWAH